MGTARDNRLPSGWKKDVDRNGKVIYRRYKLVETEEGDLIYATKNGKTILQEETPDKPGRRVRLCPLFTFAEEVGYKVWCPVKAEGGPCDYVTETIYVSSATTDEGRPFFYLPKHKENIFQGMEEVSDTMLDATVKKELAFVEYPEFPLDFKEYSGISSKRTSL